MKKLFLFLLIISFVILACLEPEHDNPYDPENLNKAYLGGTVYGFDGLPIQGAIVKLKRDAIIFREVASDDNGWYEFTGLVPDVYHLIAEAGYYRPLYMYDIDIAPGSNNDSFDLYFQEIYFDFEGEPVGNFWLDVKIKILSTNMGNWETGVVLRYQDELNFYLLVLRLDEMTLYKFQGGNFHELAKDENMTFSLDTWYCLSVDFQDDDIEVFLDQNSVFQSSDNAFSEGFIGLYVKTWDDPDTASVYFDDISIWP
jgi:hypothetical protein